LLLSGIGGEFPHPILFNIGEFTFSKPPNCNRPRKHLFKVKQLQKVLLVDRGFNTPYLNGPMPDSLTIQYVNFRDLSSFHKIVSLHHTRELEMNILIITASIKRRVRPNSAE
jgi:hypothetical protein